jgi:hypothetical protein
MLNLKQKARESTNLTNRVMSMSGHQQQRHDGRQQKHDASEDDAAIVLCELN